MWNWTKKPGRGLATGWTQVADDITDLIGLPKPKAVPPETARLVESCGVPQVHRNVGAFVALVGDDTPEAVGEALRGLLAGLAVGAGLYTLMLVG